MKIASKQYAESLYQAVQNKNDSRIKDAIKIFFQILVQNNDLSKADEIINEFVKIWNKENGIIEAGVESAKTLDNNIIKLLNNYIIKLSGAKTVILNQKINKDILGGVIIKYGDKILDGSLRMRLGELRRSLVI
ncbi:ATP synthase F1 subunit delta [Patescibacteria group bacterium]|nr:ATP synthase F1 subunit delta [Candidatus Falkowbacteria bacterium]MBU3906542.1 ATP synthase F1 subunit delta [Patescibacteria group bacterium]MCG2698135.1 ATP synthase F1 subunit delta [Candidatus Parcubacteria bacterium]MBU4014656.1 ATP synthase F1 subunit delta [Patescibacteria group bacterium]MBU4026576.1 ATP synthase F1 subunit delta [Patescibacteria group bacterium]